jgi:uncharacterized membrane protein YeaQ/YmgE (transglycosylase-associated protein family)
MMHVIGILFVGLIVGAIARMLLPGDQKMGWTLTSLVGVAGSFIAGYAGKALGLYQEGQPAGWIASVVGAVVLLFVVGKVQGGSSSGGGDRPQA